MATGNRARYSQAQPKRKPGFQAGTETKEDPREETMVPPPEDKETSSDQPIESWPDVETKSNPTTPPNSGPATHSVVSSISEPGDFIPSAASADGSYSADLIDPKPPLDAPVATESVETPTFYYNEWGERVIRLGARITICADVLSNVAVVRENVLQEKTTPGSNKPSFMQIYYQGQHVALSSLEVVGASLVDA